MNYFDLKIFEFLRQKLMTLMTLILMTLILMTSIVMTLI